LFHAEQTFFGLGFEFADHSAHGRRHGHPLVELPEAVDPQADQKDDELVTDLRGETLASDLGPG